MSVTWDTLGSSDLISTIGGTLQFLDLTNEVLRKYNEVELTSSNFASATGIHAMIKDNVNTAIRDIHQYEMEWPFDRLVGTQVLAYGTSAYALPVDCVVVDWNTFYLQSGSALPIPALPAGLPPQNYYDYLANRKPEDDAQGASGPPECVVRPISSTSFIVSPVPDQAYTVTFEYFGYGDALVNATDVTNIPARYRHVIVDGALYYYWLAKDKDNATLTFQKFQLGMKTMRNTLVPRKEYVRDTRVSPSISRNYI